MSILSDIAVREYHRDGFHLARGFFDAEEIDPVLRSAKERRISHEEMACWPGAE